MKNPKCNGCITNHKCMFIIYEKIYYINRCPCRNCLVKTMCIENCDEREILTHRYFEEADG